MNGAHSARVWPISSPSAPARPGQRYAGATASLYHPSANGCIRSKPSAAAWQRNASMSTERTLVVGDLRLATANTEPGGAINHARERSIFREPRRYGISGHMVSPVRLPGAPPEWLV